jgi:hypothetical protein
MVQEQHEALHEGHLDEEKSEPQRREIHHWRRPVVAL